LGKVNGGDKLPERLTSPRDSLHSRFVLQQHGEYSGPVGGYPNARNITDVRKILRWTKKKGILLRSEDGLE